MLGHVGTNEIWNTVKMLNLICSLNLNQTKLIMEFHAFPYVQSVFLSSQTLVAFPNETKSTLRWKRLAMRL